MVEEKFDPKFEEVKGKAKEAAGRVLGDKELEVEGYVEKEIGRITQDNINGDNLANENLHREKYPEEHLSDSHIHGEEHSRDRVSKLDDLEEKHSTNIIPEDKYSGITTPEDRVLGTDVSGEGLSRDRVSEEKYTEGTLANETIIEPDVKEGFEDRKI